MEDAQAQRYAPMHAGAQHAAPCMYATVFCRNADTPPTAGRGKPLPPPQNAPLTSRHIGVHPWLVVRPWCEAAPCVGRLAFRRAPGPKRQRLLEIWYPDENIVMKHLGSCEQLRCDIEANAASSRLLPPTRARRCSGPGRRAACGRTAVRLQRRLPI